MKIKDSKKVDIKPPAQVKDNPFEKFGNKMISNPDYKVMRKYK